MALPESPAAARRWLRRPPTWWTGFVVWWITLVILSSNALPDTGGPEIPHLDKLAHFVYFSLGAACLMLALRCTASPARSRALRLFLVAVVTISGIGALDEWYQTFNPARSGADVWDWSADTLGAIAGAATARRLRWPMG